MNEPDQTVSDPAEEKRVETTVEETVSTPQTPVEQTVTETETSQTVTETSPAEQSDASE